MHTQKLLKDNAASPRPELGPKTLSELLDREFIFVTGKGGVGKSTAAALLGLACGQSGRRALIVLPADDSDRNTLFGKKLKEKPTQIAEGVDAVIIRPETAMRQYLSAALGSRRLASLLFHSRVAKGLLMGIPGPSDWAILGKAWSWSASGTFELPDEEKRYDLVILDAPASGDGSDMLRIPQVIIDLAPAARLRQDAEICLKSLRDPNKSAVVLVTLPEEVVVQETEENIEVLRQDLKLPLGPLLVNQVRKPILDPKDRLRLNEANDPEALAAMASNTTENAPLSPELRHRRCFEIARNQALRESLQAKHLARIHRLGLPIIQIPHVEGSLSGISALKKLQMALAQGH